MFTFDGLCGMHSESINLPNDTAKTPITYSLWVVDGRLHHVCEYDRARFSHAFVESFVRAFDNAIVRMVGHTDPKDIDLSDDITLEQIAGFNDTAVEQDLSITPLAMIERHMRESPDRTAVVFNGRSITYSELDSLSTRIGAYVQSKGIGTEDYVSVLVHRSENIAVATVGVIRSGAAYQPLDPSYPKERLNFMVKDSGARLVIADRDLIGLLDEYKGDVLFTDEMEKLTGTHRHVDTKPGDAFTILYTSGTTGTPKGCILENRNVASTVNHYARNLESGPDMRTASYASYGFDANMMDIFVTLCAGGALYVIPEDMRLDLPQVDRFFTENGITHAFMTTQVGRQFITMTRCRTLKHFLVGGEKLVPVVPTEWVDFVNIYGPTETSIYVLSSHVKDDNPLCPIGRPNDNTRVYVVDGSGHQLPIGAVGELYIAGPQVSRGYLNRPDKTAEAFIRNPFTDEPDYRNAYRTGDVVRWLPDGNIEYIGRRDGQVKIRGFRVELTEIEKVIREFEGIKDATVAAFDSPSGGKFVAAYVVSDGKVDIDALNAFIAARKPPYMVPAATMQIDRIPLNVNSKVDRRKLPVPTPSTRTAGKMPSNDMEKKLCDIYAAVLGLETVYADDSFFAIGGTSISASRLVVSCMNEGIPIVYKNVFDNPTPIALAAFLRGYGGKREEKVEEVQTDSGVLAYNVAENLDGISRHGIGDVLLTGATGFLGIHVLKEVLDRKEGSVTCLIRGNKRQSARDRLKTMLMYYFGGSISESDIERIGVVEADITDAGLKDALSGLHIDTIINCAAVVKHFAFDDSIEKVNHYGVRNLIDVALAHDAVLMQTSTLSVAGESVNGSVPESVLLKENMLEFGQNLDNKYVHSKHMAERAILEAIEKDGLKGKIFRAGNLMSRESDGEFQINFATNNFMRCIRSYILLGCYPVDDLDASAEFSPIDMTAKALVTLAGTPERYTVFNGNNPHCVHMYNVIEVLRSNGFEIDIVSREEFDRRFAEKLKDESVAGDISGLISYMGNDGEFRREIGADNRYTVKALYRLGFSWPIIDLGYIERAVKSLEEFRFFRNER
jgi:amino acid adenylation domain-containing protein/thioester reductase-like protein